MTFYPLSSWTLNSSVNFLDFFRLFKDAFLRQMVICGAKYTVLYWATAQVTPEISMIFPIIIIVIEYTFIRKIKVCRKSHLFVDMENEKPITFHFVWTCENVCRRNDTSEI